MIEQAPGQLRPGEGAEHAVQDRDLVLGGQAGRSGILEEAQALLKQAGEELERVREALSRVE